MNKFKRGRSPLRKHGRQYAAATPAAPAPTTPVRPQDVQETSPVSNHQGKKLYVVIGQRYPSAAAAYRSLHSLGRCHRGRPPFWTRLIFFSQSILILQIYFRFLFIRPHKSLRSSPRSLQNMVVCIIYCYYVNTTTCELHLFYIQNNRGYCLDFRNNLILLLYYTVPRVTLIELFLLIYYEVTKHVLSL